jgi:ATP-dependent DNA ligase
MSRNSYVRSMFEFCIPTKGTSVPSGPDWLHEVKHDGYRLRLERDGDRVRLITRGGYNWTDRLPLDCRGRAQGVAEEVRARPRGGGPRR